MSPAGVGNTNVASLIGGILGFFCSGPVLDFCAKKGSEWNHGIYEPEFRLWPVVISWAFQFSGFVGFGFSVQNSAPWFFPPSLEDLMIGLLLLFVSLSSISEVWWGVTLHMRIYSIVIDREVLRPLLRSESTAMWLLLDSYCTFLPWSSLMCSFTNNWLAAQGPRNTFVTIAGLLTAFHALTIPMYYSPWLIIWLIL